MGFIDTLPQILLPSTRLGACRSGVACGVHKVLSIAIHRGWANGNDIVIDFHHFKALWNMAAQ